MAMSVRPDTGVPSRSPSGEHRGPLHRVTATRMVSVRYGEFDAVRFVEDRQLDVGHVGDSLFFEYADQENPDAVFARL